MSVLHQTNKRRLYRSRKDRMLGGVAGGFADYLGVDPSWVRIGFVVASILLPPALLLDPVLYAALWIIVPLEPERGRDISLAD